MELDLIGKWAFIIGLIVAILAAFITTIDTNVILLILFILGLIVGFINVNKKNTTDFLIAVIALVGVGTLGALAIEQLAKPVVYLQIILNNFTVFIMAAALVVSIKTILTTAKK